MKTLIKGGTVVSMDTTVGDFEGGDVLIGDGVIVEVAECIEAPDATVIDATDRIVMPGFIDNHRHTWQTAFRGIGADWTFADYLVAIHGTLRPRYTPEDVYVGNLLGRLEALHSGVTTMLDWFHCAEGPEHADAAVTGLRDAPGRSIFCYGAAYRKTGPIDAEIRRVRSALSGDGLVTMALGLRTSVHVDGLSGGRPVADLRDHDLLRDTTTFVHANGISDDELRMLADAGSSISISRKSS
jgi:cytosine/adenosine deaminase-related metal-dependent hydrolase